MADQVIPLTSDPEQSFEVALSINGNTVRLQVTVYFNEMSGYWLMDISDSNSNPLLASIPLITGTWPAANILAQYQYLNIGSAYVINIGNNPNDYPTSSSLGNDFVLVWSDQTT